MKIIGIFLLGLGFLMVVYAVFSRFYGQPSIALYQFRSLSVLILGNTLLVLSLIAIHANRYFK